MFVPVGMCTLLRNDPQEFSLSPRFLHHTLLIFMITTGLFYRPPELRSKRWVPSKCVMDVDGDSESLQITLQPGDLSGSAGRFCGPGLPVLPSAPTSQVEVAKALQRSMQRCGLQGATGQPVALRNSGENKVFVSG